MRPPRTPPPRLRRGLSLACRRWHTALLALALAACGVLPTEPQGEPSAVSASRAPAPSGATPAASAPVPRERREPARLVCDLAAPMAEFAQIESLSPEDLRREHLAAVVAFQAEPTEANRARLIYTLVAPRLQWRDDARVIRLLEMAEPGPATDDCASQFQALLLRVAIGRARLMRDEQRRHEAALRDEQRNHELMVREEARRYETLVREMRTRNEALERKLDALIEIDRRLRREMGGARR